MISRHRAGYDFLAKHPAPNAIAYPRLTFKGRACTAYPAQPEHVVLRYDDGTTEQLSLGDFRALPRDQHLIIRDEFWDALGGREKQVELEAYLYGPRS